MKTKRVVGIVLSILMIFMSLAGCGQKSTTTETAGEKSSSKTQETSKTKEVTTISYAFWDNRQEPAMRAMADKFEENNPGIKVQLEVTPWSEYWTKLEAAATGNALPDVFWMHTNEFVKYAANDMLMEVGDMVEKDPELDYSNYEEVAVKLYEYNGKNYAMPKDIDSIVIFYNKEIFDQAGVAYPDATWDWNKLIEVAKQLTDEEKGIYGFGAKRTAQQGYYNFVYQNEGYIVSEDKTKSGFDAPETVEAMQWYKDLVDKHHVSPTQEQIADTDVMELFSAGKLAMVPLGSWCLVGLTENADIQDKFDIAVLPKGKKEAAISNGLGNCVAANTKHPEEAKKFLKFLGSKEANVIAAEKGTAIPAYKETQSKWLEVNAEYNVQAILDMVKVGVPIPTSKTKGKWYQMEKDIMRKAFANTVTVEEGCKMVADEMNKLLETEK